MAHRNRILERNAARAALVAACVALALGGCSSSDVPHVDGSPPIRDGGMERPSPQDAAGDDAAADMDAAIEPHEGSELDGGGALPAMDAFVPIDAATDGFVPADGAADAMVKARDAADREDADSEDADSEDADTDSAPWAPPPGAVPASGNYIFIDSTPGEFVGDGRSYLYTQANAVIRMDTLFPGEVRFEVDGFERWRAGFEPVADAPRIEPGYWPQALGHPFYAPGVSWSGEGRGCSGVEGWLLIDQVEYSGDELAAIDLRFEQRCGGLPLRGAIHWRTDDPTVPPGPLDPPPASLWRPTPGSTPASGNYVFLQNSDYPRIYTAPAYTISVSSIVNSPTGNVSIGVSGPLPIPSDFEAMVGYPRLVTGYYPDARRHPFHNPARGGFSWMAGCDFEGWFAIDHITYDGPQVIELDLRFEQLCDGSTIVLHGQVHYVAP